jgi:hypothetical protein
MPRGSHCEAQGTAQLQKTFMYKDLPKDINRDAFRSYMIPKWLDLLSTFDDPWDLGDVLQDAQNLFDECFGIVTTIRYGYKLAPKNEPIYYLVSVKSL